MADKDLLDNVIAGQLTVLKAGQVVSVGNHAILQNIGTMKTYLLGNGYTADTLFRMTRNDVIYACKLKLGLLPN